MILSGAPKTLAAVAKPASAPLRRQQGAFGRFCFDRVPIMPTMCNSRASRIDSEQTDQRGTNSC